jgi:hypothetical protein
MWGIVLILVALAGLALSIVSWHKVAVALRQAGYGMFSRRPPLSELPRPVRRQVLRTILRGEPVPPEFQANARNWAGYQVVFGGFGWTYLWLAITIIPPLLLEVVGTDPLARVSFWLMVGCVGLLAFGRLLMWQYHRAARRLLRDTSPPA